MRSLLCCLVFMQAVTLAHAGGVSGSWVNKGASRAAMSLKTQQVGERVHFRLKMSTGAPSFESRWIEGDFDLVGNSGVFRSGPDAPCTLRFSFYRTIMELTQEEDSGDCGFGLNVSATGAMTRMDHALPFFVDFDPRLRVR